MNQYKPDHVSTPGETLQETLTAIGMTQAELSRRMRRPKKTIDEICKGKAQITPQTAIQLELALKVPAEFWISLESNYRLHLALKRMCKP